MEVKGFEKQEDIEVEILTDGLLTYIVWRFAEFRVMQPINPMKIVMGSLDKTDAEITSNDVYKVMRAYVQNQICYN